MFPRTLRFALLSLLIDTIIVVWLVWSGSGIFFIPYGAALPLMAGCLGFQLRETIALLPEDEDQPTEKTLTISFDWTDPEKEHEDIWQDKPITKNLAINLELTDPDEDDEEAYEDTWQRP